MWLFTTFGFFSIVQKHGDDLTIRARVASDLDQLRTKYLPSLSATKSGSGTDYPHRATVPHAGFARALAAMAREIHYPNFKSEVLRQSGSERELIYERVWNSVRTLEQI